MSTHSPSEPPASSAGPGGTDSRPTSEELVQALRAIGLRQDMEAVEGSRPGQVKVRLSSGSRRVVVSLEPEWFEAVFDNGFGICTAGGDDEDGMSWIDDNLAAVITNYFEGRYQLSIRRSRLGFSLLRMVINTGREELTMDKGGLFRNVIHYRAAPLGPPG